MDEITNLIQYGTYGNVWVLKAGEFGMIIDNKYYTVPLQEMKNASDDRNGAAAIMHNLYLYFSLHNGLERYFENSLDGMGPEKLDDVPTWRKGPIIDLAGYPGWLFAAIDSTSLYSYTRKGSILVWNGRGWHPFYICPKGLYTNSIKAQSTPGDNVDRLWVSVGGDILWLPISFDPTRDQDVSYNFFTHAPTGYLVTGRIFTEVMDTEKFFEALKLNLENINTGLEWVEAEYRIDDTPIWTLIGSYTAEPFEEKSISASNDKTGRWIQQRITLNTAYNNTTPRVWAMILKGLVKYPIEYLITLNFRVATSDRDMNGDPDPQTVAQKFALLDVWEAQAAPVSMSSVITRLNGKYVHIDPGSQRIVRYTLKDDGIERYISQVRLKEV